MTRNGWIAVALATTAALLWLVTSMKTGGDRPRTSDPTDDAEPAAAAPVAEAPEAEQQPAPAEPPDPALPSTPAPAAAPGEQPEPAAEEQPTPPPTTPLPPPEKTGPVDELKARFTSEPRDSSAGTFEKRIEAAFKSKDVPAALFKSVLCRQTVCRVETRWTPDRAIGFMSGFTRLLMIPPGSQQPRLFDSNLAISPEGDPDASGERPVDVYIARLPPPEEPAP